MTQAVRALVAIRADAMIVSVAAGDDFAAQLNCLCTGCRLAYNQVLEFGSTEARNFLNQPALQQA
jgi:hypothetical protein